MNAPDPLTHYSVQADIAAGHAIVESAPQPILNLDCEEAIADAEAEARKHATRLAIADMHPDAAARGRLAFEVGYLRSLIRRVYVERDALSARVDELEGELRDIEDGDQNEGLDADYRAACALRSL